VPRICALAIALFIAVGLTGGGKLAKGEPRAAVATEENGSVPAPPAPAAAEESARGSSAAPSSSAAPAASANRKPEASDEQGLVRVRDRNVFTIRTAHGNQSASARARAASQVLERLVEEREPVEVHVEERGDLAVVFAGTTPIVQLRAEDAAAAGDVSLGVHAASIAAKVRETLRIERQRKAIAETVFSFSLLVFSGLIAVLLLGKIRELTGKTQSWIEHHPDRLPALRVQGIELIQPAAVRGGLFAALRLGRILSLIGIAYGWVLFASSLFESTRGYTERLTGFVLTPLSALIGRVGSALPLLVIVLSAIIATVLLVRFVGLFFGSVARGETNLRWLPYDLAVPTGALVRLGIVVVALLVAAPLITGSNDGALARTGIAALVALGFASSPVLASIAAGIPAIYGRKVRVGDYAEVGGRTGRVLSVTLLEVRMEDEMGCQVRVPHLMSLVHSTRVLGPSPVRTLDVVVDPTAPQTHVRSVLLSAATRVARGVNVDLVKLDADGAHYRVAARGLSADTDGELPVAVADALAHENIALGRAPNHRP